VLLEALASGLPIAAFPVAGPRDVVGAAPVGVLSEDLREACLTALGISRQICVEFAACHSWEASARVFIEHMPLLEARGARRGSAEYVAEQPGCVA
jgi:glycosyltransferase involved in cell wall biosynthesis